MHFEDDMRNEILRSEEYKRMNSSSYGGFNNSFPELDKGPQDNMDNAQKSANFGTMDCGAFSTGHISIEFRTKKQNVILLYAGPMGASDTLMKVMIRIWMTKLIRFNIDGNARNTLYIDFLVLFSFQNHINKKWSLYCLSLKCIFLTFVPCPSAAFVS